MNKHIAYLQEALEEHIEMFWEDSKYIKHIQSEIDKLLTIEPCTHSMNSENIQIWET